MKARAPSPAVSAIRARHSSTSLRALVRPFPRSSASDASVGVFGITFSPRRLFGVRGGFDLQIEQRRTQGFAVGIERQRPRHPAAERAGHHEIQRRNVGKLIADNLAFDNTRKMRPDPRAGDLLK